MKRRVCFAGKPWNEISLQCTRRLRHLQENNVCIERLFYFTRVSSIDSPRCCCSLPFRPAAPLQCLPVAMATTSHQRRVGAWQSHQSLAEGCFKQSTRMKFIQPLSMHQSPTLQGGCHGYEVLQTISLIYAVHGWQQCTELVLSLDLLIDS